MHVNMGAMHAWQNEERGILCFVQEKHVGFEATSTLAGMRPNRLHRRDTPHHLKNKRINQATNIDKDKVAAIIANVSKVSSGCNVL